MHFLAILATFKNEAMILKEWVDHHRWQGVDHIYLINNNSDDDYMSVLREYIKEGYITLYNLPGKYQQINNYNIVYNEIRGSVDWLAICDIDEYWYTPTGTVKDYIKKIDQEGIHLVYTQWYAFGSSGYIDQPQNIRESFTKRAKETGSVKCITKTSNTLSLHIHQHILTDSTVVKSESEALRLNHYRVMSKEYFTKTKLVRGSPSGFPSLEICDIYRDEVYFEENDINDVEDNTLAQLVANISMKNTQSKAKAKDTLEALKQLSTLNRTN